MDFSKLQIVALVVLTTILTDKFLINHNSYPQPQAVLPVPTSIVNVTSTPPPIGVTAAPSLSQNELLLKEIQNLRKDMLVAVNNLQNKTTAPEAIPTFSTSLLGGMVKISSPQFKRVDVYDKANSSGKIINSIVYDTIYFYSTKADGWYQLSLDNGQVGYVQSQFLKEFP